MKEQNYSNHRKFVLGYHIITFFTIAILLVLSVYSLIHALKLPEHRILFFMVFLIAIALTNLFFYARSFSTKAQDRAIRAEENLRYFVCTGKLLDPKLTMSQIIALRFAPDDEFVQLVGRALNENLKSDDIKKAIKNWKADHYRV